jgi:membrane-associated phospholipid phosphatase
MQAALIAPAPAPSVSTVTTFDDGWYRSVTDFARHTTWLNGIMSLLTVALIVALALMLVYAAWRAWRAADRVAVAASAWAVAGSVLSIGLGLGLKQVFQETRPCLALPDVTTVQACPGPTDYSFPSDHTTVAVALAAGLWLINRRLGAIGGVMALMEGFSRVYLGQHYPHDVLAAFVLSSVVVLGGWPLVRKPLLRLAGRVPTLAGGVPQGIRGTQTQSEGVAEATHVAQSPQPSQSPQTSQPSQPLESLESLESLQLPQSPQSPPQTSTATAGPTAPSPSPTAAPPPSTSAAPSPSTSAAPPPSPSAESAGS